MRLSLQCLELKLHIGSTSHAPPKFSTIIMATPTFTTTHDFPGYSVTPSDADVKALSESLQVSTVWIVDDADWRQRALAQLDAHAILSTIPQSQALVESATAASAMVSYCPANIYSRGSADTLDVLLRIGPPADTRFVSLLDTLLVKPAAVENTVIQVGDFPMFAQSPESASAERATWAAFLAGHAPCLGPGWGLTISSTYSSSSCG